MHLGLIDRLSCPRCGPDFGLILLASRVRDRRVLEGDLGCSKCRGTYPVRGGHADLGVAPPLIPRPNPPRADPASADPEPALRLGALLGVAEGPGTLLIQGPAAMHARRLAELIPGVEVVVMGGESMEEGESDGVSRVTAQGRIPFFSNTFRGIILSGKIGEGELDEAARSVAPLGRVAVLDAPDGAARRAEELGLKILLEEDAVLVALKERSRSSPLVTLRGS